MAVYVGGFADVASYSAKKIKKYIGSTCKLHIFFLFFSFPSPLFLSAMGGQRASAEACEHGSRATARARPSTVAVRADEQTSASNPYTTTAMATRAAARVTSINSSVTYR